MSDRGGGLHPPSQHHHNETLSQVHNLRAPSWVNHSCRKMPVPYFAAKSPNMKAILLQESPAAFRVRNLFVSANALSRA